MQDKYYIMKYYYIYYANGRGDNGSKWNPNISIKSIQCHRCHACRPNGRGNNDGKQAANTLSESTQYHKCHIYHTKIEFDITKFRVYHEIFLADIIKHYTCYMNGRGKNNNKWDPSASAGPAQDHKCLSAMPTT